MLELVPLVVLRASYIDQLKQPSKGNYFNALCVELVNRGYDVKAPYLHYSTRYYDKYTKEEFYKVIEYLRTKGYIINAHGYIKSRNWKFWRLEDRKWVFKNDEGVDYDENATFYTLVR